MTYAADWQVPLSTQIVFTSLSAFFFFLASPTYAPLFWCYSDKSPVAVSVNSHSFTKPSCCFVTAQTTGNIFNSYMYVWQACLPIIVKNGWACGYNFIFIAWVGKLVRMFCLTASLVNQFFVQLLDKCTTRSFFLYNHPEWEE